MSNCVYCKKQILTKFIFSLLDLKSKEIQMALNISKSVVSRYLTGERGCPEIDLYIIEKIFGIKVKKDAKPGNSTGTLSQEMRLVSKKSGEYKPVTVYTDPLTGKKIAPDVGWSHNPADFREGDVER